MIYGKNCSIELAASDTKLYAVMPDAPIPTLFFQSLLSACKCFSKFVLNCIAVCHICPRVRLRFVNLNHVPKAENCFLKLFKTHVRAATGKPLPIIQSVDLKSLFKAVDCRFEVVFIKSHPA